jgi:hypothetical protein
MRKKPIDDLLVDALIKQLEIRDSGYTGKSSDIIRELLWDIQDVLGKNNLMSESFDAELTAGVRDIPRPFTGEHKTPVKVIIDECMKIYRSHTFNGNPLFEQVTDVRLHDELREYLGNNLEVVHITEQEDEKLRKMGLSQSVHTFQDRYERVGIVLSDHVLVRNGSTMKRV